jgi:signal transduction histidine kinase/HAMP domain-containing protein
MLRLTIRTRLILLTSAGLFVVVATNLSLTRVLHDNSARIGEAAALLGVIKHANSARAAFGEERYWMTDLAVSQLTLSERNAAEARARMERDLDRLAPRKPQQIVTIRSEHAQYEEFAEKAVDEYTNDRRVVGNSLLAQARLHSLVVDRLLAAIVTELTGEMIAARDRAVAEATIATRITYIVLSVAVLLGALLTFLVLRSIAHPLRRLVIAMDGLNAGNVAVAIPPAGADEVGAMARTLARFRDTLKELHDRTDELGQQQAVLRVTFDNMADGVVRFDEALRLAAWNRNFMELLDFPDSFVAEPRSYADCVRYLAERGDLGAVDPEAELRRLTESATRQWTGEWSRPDGRVLEVRNTPVPGGGFVLIYSDITERKRAEAQIRAARDAAERALRELRTAQASLVHAQKMAALGQLTAGIAHEIKNPLNFVNNFADLSVELLDELKDTTEPAVSLLGEDARAEINEIVAMLTGNLEKIAEHGRRADGIVKSMLAHSRGGGGDRHSVDVEALVEEALNLAYHGARAQDQNFNITLERDFDPNIMPIELVPQDITRVLLNLFGNGLYAADKRRREANDPNFEPRLKVTTRDRGTDVEIRVRDNGAGIPHEFRDKLFQPFFTTKPPGEGTGLGLSISWDIVTQQHGGMIEVDSVAGEFTEFTIRLPRRGAAGADLAVAAAGAVH